MFSKYEFLGLSTKKDGTTLYKIRVSGNGSTGILKLSYKQVQDMWAQGKQISHLILGVSGKILNDETYEVEFKRLFQDMIDIALRESSLSKFIVGEVYHVKFGLTRSCFRLNTNVTYRGLPVELQFEMQPTEELNEPFDKPPIKLKVQYLVKGRSQRELYTCLVFDKLKQHILGMPDYTNLQIRVFMLGVSSILLRLSSMSKTLFSDILEKSVYKSNIHLYATEIAELLCARLVDKYNIIGPCPYLIEALSNNMISNERSNVFFADSEFIKGIYHLDESKYGKVYTGVGVALPIRLASLNTGWDAGKVCSILPRLWLTERGLLLQLIKIYTSGDINSIINITIYKRSLVENDFFLPSQSFSRGSICKLIDEFIEYIDDSFKHSLSFS